MIKDSSSQNRMVAYIDQNPTNLEKVCFSDKATVHVSGHVHHHHMRIWGKFNPYVVLERERDSRKVIVWATVLHKKVIGPFFFKEKTMKKTNFLKIKQEDAYPLLAARQLGIVFQLAGCRAHLGLNVCDSLQLNDTFPNKFIWRDPPTPVPNGSVAG